METYELRYFLGVAREENLHRTSERLKVSPASLSKAVARLEAELSVKLFRREGRNIRLSDAGRLLQKRGQEMIRLEEDARMEITGNQATLHVVIAGPEILMAKFGVPLAAKIKRRAPLADFEFRAIPDSAALLEVQMGQAHLAIVTSDLPENGADVRAEAGAEARRKSRAIRSRFLNETKFRCYSGKGHPLFAKARSGTVLPVVEVLKHGFASPDRPFLGRVGAHQSLDGWRDDAFPRKVEYLTSSLKLLEALAVEGAALAYLPQYLGESLGLAELKISGCPYSCTQRISLVAKKPRDHSWMHPLF